MSLFPSSFDAGLSSASSSRPLAAAGGNKRKRPSTGGGAPREDQVRATQANLEKLMSRVEKGQVQAGRAEGSEAMGMPSAKKNKKNRKGSAFGAMHDDEDEDEPRQSASKRGGPADQGQKGKDGKGKQSKNQNGTPSRGDERAAASAFDTPVGEKRKGDSNRPAPAELPLPHNISASKKGKRAAGEGGEDMTDLQRGMQAKLEGARFRWINEQLYSTPSTEAVAMMKKDPKIFADYHMTHRALTSAWPSPPLPHIIELLQPLPPKTLIVDLGCGDAGLARALVPQGKIVLSYDLVGDSGMPGEGSGSSNGDGWVVEADFLDHIPLPGRTGGSSSSAAAIGEAGAAESEAPKKSKKGRGKGKAAGSEIVDAAVCCLSLMGVNWVGGIYEACRVLKKSGSFHIAEVTSRFVAIPDFVEMVSSFGFELEKQSAPSTHFTLFHFVKTAEVPIGPVKGERGWESRVKEGESILRGCVYKKR